MDQNYYLIYQMKRDQLAWDFSKESRLRENRSGNIFDRDIYDHVYTGTLGPYKATDLNTLHEIWDKIDNARPIDFAGRSMSVGDVIALLIDGGIRAYYVEEVGYRSAVDFQNGAYRYYSTSRPIDIGTYPKTENGPVEFVNYDERKWVENKTFRAWGYLAYDAPLSKRRISDYELRPASDNPDDPKVAPIQFEAQIKIVANWEKERNVPEAARLTKRDNELGAHICKEWIKPEQISGRCYYIANYKPKSSVERNGDLEPITERLARAARAVTESSRSLSTNNKRIVTER